MGRCRFVQPEIVRLHISDGDWVDVKRRLSVGEERAAFQQIVGEVNTKTDYRKPNVELMGIAEMAAYIVQWSLTDAGGRPVPVGIGAIQSMDPADFKEIEEAVSAHIKAMDDAETVRKNVQGGPKGPEQILQSA